VDTVYGLKSIESVFLRRHSTVCLHTERFCFTLLYQYIYVYFPYALCSGRLLGCLLATQSCQDAERLARLPVPGVAAGVGACRFDVYSRYALPSQLFQFGFISPFIFVLTPPGVGLCARHPDPEKKGGQLHQRVGLPFGGANHVPVYVGASYSAP